MSEPFLDTDYVRNEFSRGAYSQREMSQEFDRWLDSVKADAWDEAIDYAWDDSSIYQADAARAKSKNPYRADRLEAVE